MARTNPEVEQRLLNVLSWLERLGSADEPIHVALYTDRPIQVVDATPAPEPEVRTGYTEGLGSWAEGNLPPGGPAWIPGLPGSGWEAPTYWPRVWGKSSWQQHEADALAAFNAAVAANEAVDAAIADGSLRRRPQIGEAASAIRRAKRLSDDEAAHLHRLIAAANRPEETA